MKLYFYEGLYNIVTTTIQDRVGLSAKGLCGRFTRVRVELALTMKLNRTMMVTMAMNRMVTMNMTMMLMMTMTLTRVMVELNRVEKPGLGYGFG